MESPLPAIEMEERVRIEGRVASALLTAPDDGGMGSSVPPESDLTGVELNIFTAAQHGKTDDIRFLIDSDQANATERDRENVTALHWAAINGMIDTCEYLIERGAEVNAVGGELRATPLQWAARNGLINVMHVLIKHDADPCIFDAQGFNCLHSVVHSSSYWGLLYILCQPGISVDERDSKGHTALQWAVYQGDEVSTRILLKFGADPNAVDDDRLTVLHWAVVRGNKNCIRQLLEKSADVRVRDAEGRTPRDLANELHSGIWRSISDEHGMLDDGSRERRPLNEPHIRFISFLIPAIALCLAFSTLTVFPWYLSLLLAPAVAAAMHLVVLNELLQRRSFRDDIDASPYGAGIIVGSAWWIAYMWFTRLSANISEEPYVHIAFMLAFCTCMCSFVCTMYRDPGICIPLEKDALRSVVEDLIKRDALNVKTFCTHCLVEKPPSARHCSLCKRCVERHSIMKFHAGWVMNCIGTKNHVFFVSFLISLFVGVSILDYLAWNYLRGLDARTQLAHSSCVLPGAVCKLLAKDTFLCSVVVWSTMMQLVWCGLAAIDYIGSLFKRVFGTI
ncbi:ankyrin repeat-containing domain protein [Gloeopeniophorella convolvens]|nr:ankyrin repeat-containing domain protein [Gloeopeniophorella convolvens]